MEKSKILVHSLYLTFIPHLRICISHLVFHSSAQQTCDRSKELSLAQGHTRLGASAESKQRTIEFLIYAQPVGPQWPLLSVPGSPALVEEIMLLLLQMVRNLLHCLPLPSSPGESSSVCVWPTSHTCPAQPAACWERMWGRSVSRGMLSWARGEPEDTNPLWGFRSDMWA